MKQGSDIINNKDINVLVLAYLGDNIYEYYVRKFLVEQNISSVDVLQKTAVNYVSAKNQASYLEKLINNNFFTEEELSIIKRARNHKGHGHPKNCDIVTYKHATALEALTLRVPVSPKKDEIKFFPKSTAINASIFPLYII